MRRTAVFKLGSFTCMIHIYVCILIRRRSWKQGCITCNSSGKVWKCWSDG